MVLLVLLKTAFAWFSRISLLISDEGGSLEGIRTFGRGKLLLYTDSKVLLKIRQVCLDRLRYSNHMKFLVHEHFAMFPRIYKN